MVMDRRLNGYLTSTLPSVLAAATHLILQLQWDVIVPCITGNDGSDNGDIWLRHPRNKKWARVEVKWHPRYTFAELCGMRNIILENVKRWDSMTTKPIRYYVFGNTFEQALVVNPIKHQNILFERTMPDPNWRNESNPNKIVDVYMLARSCWCVLDMTEMNNDIE